MKRLVLVAAVLVFGASAWATTPRLCSNGLKPLCVRGDAFKANTSGGPVSGSSMSQFNYTTTQGSAFTGWRATPDTARAISTHIVLPPSFLSGNIKETYANWRTQEVMDGTNGVCYQQSMTCNTTGNLDVINGFSDALGQESGLPATTGDARPTATPGNTSLQHGTGFHIASDAGGGTVKGCALGDGGADCTGRECVYDVVRTTLCTSNLATGYAELLSVCLCPDVTVTPTLTPTVTPTP